MKPVSIVVFRVAFVVALSVGAALVAMGKAVDVMAASLSPHADGGKASSTLANDSTVTAKDLENLAATIEDEKKRTELIALLKTALAARAALEEERPKPEELLPMTLAAELVEKLSAAAATFSNDLGKLRELVTKAPEAVEKIKSIFNDKKKRDKFIQSLYSLAIVSIFSLILWLATRIFLKKPNLYLERLMLKTGWWCWIGRALRLVLDIFPPLMLTAATWGMLIVLKSDLHVTNAATLIMGAVAALQVVISMSATVLSPKNKSLRMISIDDESVQYILIWINRIFTTFVIGYAIIQALFILGLSFESVNLLKKFLGLIVAIILTVFILQNRMSVSKWIKKKFLYAHHDKEKKRKNTKKIISVLSDLWYVIAIFYVIVVYFVLSYKKGDGLLFILDSSFFTIAIVIFSFFISHFLEKSLVKVFSIRADLKKQYPHLEKRVDRYLPAGYAILRFFIAVITVLSVLQIWGVDVLAWVVSDLGRQVTHMVTSIGFVVLATFVLWEAATFWIENYLNPPDVGGRAVHRSARAKTLLPLLRHVLMVVLIVFLILIVLSELGINIAPLLAGAGVVGLAVGFGSQKLVQDVITGAFILFEDAISIGDVVDVGGKQGLVERITIRSIRLRGENGAVHTIPFSTVDRVTNLTKDFSYYVVNLGIAYDTETDEACAVMSEVAADLQQDEAFASFILAPLEILGVDQFADSAIMIKARIKTLPLKQWMVGREFNRRLKKAFDARDIHIPFPHITVYYGKESQNPEGKKNPPYTLSAAAEGESETEMQPQS